MSKEKKRKKKKEKEELDMETTIANMNVEGFRWYNPHRGKQNSVGKLSRKEYCLSSYLRICG